MSMDNETIALLRDSAERYTRDNYDFLQRRAVLDAPGAYSEASWRDYAELGWLALRLPEEHGGLDAGPEAIAALMEIVGSRLLMEPLLMSAVVATGLLVKQGSTAQQSALLPALASGELKLACAIDEETQEHCQLSGDRLSGTSIAVLHGDVADKLIVSASDETRSAVLCLVDKDADGVSMKPYRLLDGRGAANFSFDRGRVERLVPDNGQAAGPAIAAACDEAVVALCAEALGIVRSLVAITCDYLKVRTQFGKPIGDNQALQHRAVDMYLLLEEIAALTAAAQRALYQPLAQRARIISGARAYICHAARHVANEAIQMHGGLGITDELVVSHYFRRLMVNASLFGNRDHHFQRFLSNMD